MLKARLEIPICPPDFYDVLENYISDWLQEAKTLCSSQMYDFICELTEEMSSTFTDDDKYGDFAKWYFDKILEYRTDIRFSDGTLYNLDIDISDTLVDSMLRTLMSDNNREDFKEALESGFEDKNYDYIFDKIEENIGYYIVENEIDDEIEADRVEIAPEVLKELDDEELGIIIYCYLALCDDVLGSMHSYLRFLEETLYEDITEFNMLDHCTQDSFEEVLNWANQNYTFKPRLSSEDFSADNLLYNLIDRQLYRWDENEQAFVWNVENENQLKLKFESLTERLTRLTNEDFSPEAFKYMKGEYNLDNFISEPTQEEINEFVAKIDELPFIDEVKSIELMDGDVAMDFDIGVFCKFSEYIDWDNASINEIDKYYQAIQLVIPDFEVSMSGNRVQIYIPMGYINYQTETINGLKEVEQVVKEVHNELYK